MSKHNHVPRNAPFWWPAEEPWPPHRRGYGNLAWWRDRQEHQTWQTNPWHRARRTFWLRIVVVLGVFLLIAAIAGAALLWVAASALGIISSNEPAAYASWRGPILLIFAGLLILATAVAGSLRGTAGPVAEIMEAAKRVEAGDYAAHVRVRGPREVRELAQAFNEMVDRLRENEEQRRNMLSDVTHELRTPLTVIQGNLEGLLDDIYPRDDEHLGLILDETRVFARLVEDLRTLAQAEGGTLKLQLEQSDIGSLIRDTLASFKSQADGAGVTLVAAVADGLPLLMIDPVRIHAVIANLLVNALRYTPAGGTITVSAQMPPQANLVTVMVADTGKGIDPQLLSHLFDRFTKSSDSHGSGLGLAIARHLVMAHGGEIKAESAPGQGTCITFTLPA
jgi:signal transduction histidine kinase